MTESVTRDQTAAVLAEFWQELLDVEVVGPQDRLLELGGNSLIATMMANRIEYAWAFRPTMEQLMTFSLGELAELCQQARLEG